MLEGQSLLCDTREKLTTPLVNSQSVQLNNGNANKTALKYQYSFTDAIILDEMSSTADFKVWQFFFLFNFWTSEWLKLSVNSQKENTKFRKKVHRKAEGASILVMPVDFVTKSKLVFLRLEAATELQSLLEVRLRSRFIVLLIGPAEHQIQLYEVGRAISTCLADDVWK